MRLPALPRSTRRLWPLLAAVLFLTVGTGSVMAQAATNTWSTAPAAQVAPGAQATPVAQATASTTASSQTTASTATTVTTAAPAGQGAQADATAVVPPLAGQSPLNPGWKTDQMDVRVMPEYDQKAVLVIVGFTLPASVSLPTTLKFAIPSGATFGGIGEVDSNGNFTYNYQNSYPAVQPGTQWDIATIDVKKYRELQIEYYYDPGLPVGGGQRSFPLQVMLPLDAATLLLHVQQPARATNFQVQPALQGSGKASDGFTYAVGTYSDVKQGSTLGHTISYINPDGGLSTSASQPSGSTPVSTNTVLLAAILFVVVCIGGIVVYRMFAGSRRKGPKKGAAKTGRGSAASASPAAAKRPRPGAKTAKTPNVVTAKAASRQAVPSKPRLPETATKAPRPETAVTTAIAETAVAAESADPVTAPSGAAVEYCMACGEEMVARSRFCSNCGEARS